MPLIEECERSESLGEAALKTEPIVIDPPLVAAIKAHFAEFDDCVERRQPRLLEEGLS